jgi:hypothetical protein
MTKNMKELLEMIFGLQAVTPDLANGENPSTVNDVKDRQCL